jgi:DNA-binding PadR family transcriptional regulator
MPHDGLGEFEQLVMLAVLHLANGSDVVYGVPIVDEIQSRTRREVSRAAVYITLRRLERKGLLAAWMSEPGDERGAKSRRCVRLTPAGLKLLREARRAMNRMWKGLDPELEDGR